MTEVRVSWIGGGNVIKEDDVKDLFCQYGKVTFVEMNRCSNRCHAFVEVDVKGMNATFSNLSGRTIRGVKIHVQPTDHWDNDCGDDFRESVTPKPTPKMRKRGEGDFENRKFLDDMFPPSISPQHIYESPSQSPAPGKLNNGIDLSGKNTFFSSQGGNSSECSSSSFHHDSTEERKALFREKFNQLTETQKKCYIELNQQIRKQNSWRRKNLGSGFGQSDL